MVSDSHKKLVSKLKELDHPPENPSELTEWLAGKPIINFLLSEPCKQDVIIGAFTKHIYVYTQAFPEKDIINKETGKIHWPDMGNSYLDSGPGYVYPFVENEAGDFKKKCYIDRKGIPVGKDSPRNLVFRRGLQDTQKDNWEPLQEFTMVSDIHYQNQRKAWSRINEDTGDLEDHISITEEIDNPKFNMISFNWKTLEKYLAYENLVLVRKFEFNVCKAKQFIKNGVVFPEENEIINKTNRYNVFRNDELLPDQYIRISGLQLIRPRSLEEIFAKKKKNKNTFLSGHWIGVIRKLKKSQQILQKLRIILREKIIIYHLTLQLHYFDQAFFQNIKLITINTR